jgi:site-specific recombinase XerD
MHEDMTLRNFADLTKEHYEMAYGQYASWLEGRGRELPETDESDVREYSLHMTREQGLEPATVNNYLAVVLFLYEAVLGRPMNRAQIPFMKLPKRLPTVFSREEIRAIMDATENPSHAAIFSVAYGSGLRISEAISLRVSDIRSEEMRLHVEHGKGDKERHALLAKRTLELLREQYRTNLAGKPDGGGWVFPGLIPGSHLTDTAAREALNRALERAGVEKRDRTFHSLRASFATHMLEDGADLMTIKELMGHASISSTAVYLHVANLTRKATSPLDRC